VKLTATAAASCADVKAEMAARVDGQFAKWHDPHNNGTYTAQSYGGDWSASRKTGDGKYTDKLIFDFADAGNGACTIEACSRSQVFSVGDAGTNYCNLKMLFCGTADGCKPVMSDFASSGEKTEKFAQSTVSLKGCLKV
jgi:hypothetical protein